MIIITIITIIIIIIVITSSVVCSINLSKILNLQVIRLSPTDSFLVEEESALVGWTASTRDVCPFAVPPLTT